MHWLSEIVTNSVICNGKEIVVLFLEYLSSPGLVLWCDEAGAYSYYSHRAML